MTPATPPAQSVEEAHQLAVAAGWHWGKALLCPQHKPLRYDVVYVNGKKITFVRGQHKTLAEVLCPRATHHDRKQTGEEYPEPLDDMLKWPQ